MLSTLVFVPFVLRKKIKGRKRHILPDTDGRLLDGAKAVLKRSRARFPLVQRAYVDGGSAGRLVRWAKDKAHIVLEVVKRSAAQTGFSLILRRWVVERTFAWIVKNRRIVRTTSNSLRLLRPSSPSPLLPR